MNDEIVVGPYTIRTLEHKRKEVWITADPSKRVRMQEHQLKQFLHQAGRAAQEGKAPSLPIVR